MTTQEFFAWLGVSCSLWAIVYQLDEIKKLLKKNHP